MTLQTKPSPSPDLHAEIEDLQSEIIRFIVVKQELIDTQGLLDRERSRFRGIQQCSEALLHAEEMDAFASILLESVLTTFEFEVSLLMRFDPQAGDLEVIGHAGFDQAPIRLPFNPERLSEDTGVILSADSRLLREWAFAGLGQAVLCPFYSEKDNTFSGMVLGGITTDNQDHFDPIKEEVISSFSVMVVQAGALLSNQELKHRLQQQNEALEHHTKNLEQIVEERTSALREANRRLEAANQQSLGQLRVTEQELGRQELLAQTDELTGLYNRRFMDEQLRRLAALSRGGAGTFGMLLIDLDGFKEINDTHGHPRGDAVLRETAEVLRSSCRSTDVLCRVGGDEFAILMSGITSSRGRQVAEQIRARIEALPRRDPNRDILLSASVGGAIHTAMETPEDYFSRIDNCLYEAKRNGRNRIVWEESGFDDRYR